ncbi:MAG: bifunctional riboflavin kinase/FMN adenylyltransferase [Lachnospiraceae bacterium]|nr:bifunctional riboflavin kinase/FMN adenylyltransferase [Lachnospiraceae bacterium]
MQIIKDTTQFQIDEPTAVAVGKFDGVHLGHRALLDLLFAQKEKGLKTAVFTFDPSPGAYFAGIAQKSLHNIHSEDDWIIVRDERMERPHYRELMTREEKRLIFERMGIDYLVEYPFRAETAAVTPEDYVNRFLIDQMNARLIVAGEDVSFGKNGAGDAEMLCNLVGTRAEVKIIPKICLDGRQISSTLLRSVVAEGNMELASRLAGDDFSIAGIVQKGNRIGRTLGMPTANLYPSDDKLLPPNGVYFSKTVVYEKDDHRKIPELKTEKEMSRADATLNEISKPGSRVFYGITNIGCKPTIGEKHPRISVETCLFDFDEDIYDCLIEVRLCHFQRKEQQFDGLDALKAQMERDAQACREYFERNLNETY